jgi:hypothetical protein
VFPVLERAKTIRTLGGEVTVIAPPPLRRQGYDVVVGVLGGWDPGNEQLINYLKLGRHYCRLMGRLMGSDAIRWSRDIYVEHLKGPRGV